MFDQHQLVAREYEAGVSANVALLRQVVHPSLVCRNKHIGGRAILNLPGQRCRAGNGQRERRIGKAAVNLLQRIFQARCRKDGQPGGWRGGLSKRAKRDAQQPYAQAVSYDGYHSFQCVMLATGGRLARLKSVPRV